MNAQRFCAMNLYVFRHIQRGSSFLSLLVALFIVMVVALTLLKLVFNEAHVGRSHQLSYEYRMHQADSIVQSINKLNAGMLAMTSNSPKNQGVSTADVADWRLFPIGSVSEAAIGGTLQVSNEFGGRYFVSGNAEIVGKTTYGNGYFIYLTAIPKDQCPFIANELSRISNEVWVGVDSSFNLPVASAKMVATPASAEKVQSYGQPITAPLLASHCNRADKVTIVVFMTGW